MNNKNWIKCINFFKMNIYYDCVEWICLYNRILFIYIFQIMNQEDELKKVLSSAGELFRIRNYEASKEQLRKYAENWNHQKQINLLLIEHLINQDNGDMVLQALSRFILKLVKLLTHQNIKLYTERHLSNNEIKQLRHVDHEYLYWNIIIIALKIGRPTIAALVGNQASYFYGSFQTETSLLIIYELLNRSYKESRITNCLNCIDKYDNISRLAAELDRKSQQLSTLCKILLTRFLLSLNLIEQAQSKYMLYFGQSDKQAFSNNTDSKLQFPFEVYHQFLHSEIEYYSQKYQNSIQILGQIINNIQSDRIKILAENNLGTIFIAMGKKIVARKFFMVASQKLKKLCHDSEVQDNQKICLYEKCKQNLLLTYIHSKSQCQQIYTSLENYPFSESYRLNYRKAQICLNYYHNLLNKNERVIPWEQLHDGYDTVYYYPNDPYFQKSKNRNIYSANKKYFYKRYVLTQHQQDYGNQEIPDKDTNRKQFEKHAQNIKIKEILCKAEQYLKQALLILETQRKVVYELQSFDPQLRQQINEIIFQQYSKYKISILSILCYVELCLCQWSKCIKYGTELLKDRHAEKSDEYYNVLIYLMEAYSKMGQFQEAYDITNRLVRYGLKEDKKLQIRDSLSLSSSIFSENDQLYTFLYNVAVLHVRDNHIPQSYQSIQKILAQLRVVPTNPQTNLPLPLIDLLIHYNLRIQNYSSALQLVKRKRILTMNNLRPLLNVTK